MCPPTLRLIQESSGGGGGKGGVGNGLSETTKSETSERKKAHKLFSHKLSVPPFVPGSVPGTSWVCPRDKPGEIGLPLCKIRRKPGVVPRPTGQKSLCLCAFFLPEKQAEHGFGERVRERKRENKRTNIKGGGAAEKMDIGNGPNRVSESTTEKEREKMGTRRRRQRREEIRDRPNTVSERMSENRGQNKGSGGGGGGGTKDQEEEEEEEEEEEAVATENRRRAGNGFGDYERQIEEDEEDEEDEEGEGRICLALSMGNSCFLVFSKEDKDRDNTAIGHSYNPSLGSNRAFGILVTHFFWGGGGVLSFARVD